MAKFQIDHPFPNEKLCHSAACTLDPDLLGTHDNGWTIEGEVHRDYYTWVKEFVATHPDHGTVKGDFEKTIYATSKKAYDNFVSHFQPTHWDYGDI